MNDQKTIKRLQDTIYHLRKIIEEQDNYPMVTCTICGSSALEPYFSGYKLDETQFGKDAHLMVHHTICTGCMRNKVFPFINKLEEMRKK